MVVPSVFHQHREKDGRPIGTTAITHGRSTHISDILAFVSNTSKHYPVVIVPSIMKLLSVIFVSMLLETVVSFVPQSLPRPCPATVRSMTNEKDNDSSSRRNADLVTKTEATEEDPDLLDFALDMVGNGMGWALRITSGLADQLQEKIDTMDKKAVKARIQETWARVTDKAKQVDTDDLLAKFEDWKAFVKKSSGKEKLTSTTTATSFAQDEFEEEVDPFFMLDNEDDNKEKGDNKDEPKLSM